MYTVYYLVETVVRDVHRVQSIRPPYAYCGRGPDPSSDGRARVGGDASVCLGKGSSSSSSDLKGSPILIVGFGWLASDHVPPKASLPVVVLKRGWPWPDGFDAS